MFPVHRLCTTILSLMSLFPGELNNNNALLTYCLFNLKTNNQLFRSD